ncbi:MAG: DUF4124 domain-containing protein [Burkholderiales bacterium]|nr:DUF4124 domain-containing protein [Burkholderiales bacterium]
MRLPTCLVLLVCSASAAAGQICRYEDADGRTTYSSQPMAGMKLVSCGDRFPDEPPKPPPPSTAPARPPTTLARPAATAPAGFPKIDGDTQRRRDDARRRVLEQELADEERALADAKRALDDQLVAGRYNGADPQARARVKPLEDAITRHGRNAEAIRRELANLR